MSNKDALSISLIDGDGLEVKNIGDKHEDLALYPFEDVFVIRLDHIRIQNQDSRSSIVGFANMPVDCFERHKDENPQYSPHKTNYVNISIISGSQKHIEETDKALGTSSLNRNIGDMAANLSIEMAKNYYVELYELVKTRQLSGLKLGIIYKNSPDSLYKVQKYSKNAGSYVYSSSYAVESWTFPTGEVESIDFATLPLPLNVDNWDYYSLTMDGYDADYDSYEAYKKDKEGFGVWKELTGFQKTVLALLVIIFLAILF